MFTRRLDWKGKQQMQPAGAGSTRVYASDRRVGSCRSGAEDWGLRENEATNQSKESDVCNEYALFIESFCAERQYVLWVTHHHQRLIHLGPSYFFIIFSILIARRAAARREASSRRNSRDSFNSSRVAKGKERKGEGKGNGGTGIFWLPVARWSAVAGSVS